MRGALLWGGWGFLLLFNLVWAQNQKVDSADDRKEPKTLSKLVGTETTGRPAGSTLDAETSYRTETDFRLSPASPKPTPMPIALKSGTFNKTVDGMALRGWLTQPTRQPPRAAMLILHEWWGLNAALRDEADTWARQGFKVLALDLYNGQVARTRAEAARLMGQLMPEKVLPALKAALNVVAQSRNPDTTATLKVIVIGYGVGATYAQRLAAEDPRPAALVLFYGELLRDPERIGKIQAPTLAFFAGRDAWITPEKIQAFLKALTGTRTPPQTFSYMTQPGFMFNNQNPADRGYADLARQKTLDFLKRELDF